LISCHGLLSWSSLLLPLPSTRNFSSPMIWPEFRMHSIVFASRHVLCSVLTLNEWWPVRPIHIFLANTTVVVGTILAASRITDLYGDRTKRTTNALPYPSSVNNDARERIKDSYAKAQFAATHVCILPDTSITFFCLLGIQSAPFLMTLVRKGKIGSQTYHRAYASSLWLGFVVTVLRLALQRDFTLFAFASFLSMLVRYGRMKHHLDTKLLWTTHIFFLRLCYPFVRSLLEHYPVHRFILPWLFVSMVRQLYIYRPLFARNVE